MSIDVTEPAAEPTRVKVYTDGACSGNPGPGDWGAILIFGDTRKELSGARPTPPATAWRSWRRSGRWRL